MADLVIVEASVATGAGATVSRTKIAGESLGTGVPVYEDSADNNELKEAQATAGKEDCIGITVNSAEDGQPVALVSKDAAFTPGATVVANKIYVVSKQSGKIMPIDDILTGDFGRIIGIGISATQLNIDLDAGLGSGVAEP